MANHRPCPYCGGTNLVGAYTYHPKHRCIKCLRCGARGPDSETVADAWRKWDRRMSVNVTELKDYLGTMDAKEKAASIQQHVADAKRMLVDQQRRAEL